MSPTARRAGWVGCNILIDKIPDQGKISIIENGSPKEIAKVVEQVNKSNMLDVPDIAARGWLIDVLNLVNQIPKNIFSLKDIYKFTELLSINHPKNNNIEAKIRQQLQLLRDKKYIEFLGNGTYKKSQ